MSVFSLPVGFPIGAVRQLRAVAVVALTGAVLSSCSDAVAANGAAPVQLSFSGATTSSASTTTNPSAAASADIIMNVGTHVIDLQQVQLTVDHIELEQSDDEHCIEREDEHGGAHVSAECQTVMLGVHTIDLPLTGGVVTLDGDAVPAGTYHQLEISATHVRLHGTFDGQPFDVSMPIDLHREIELSPPLVVTAGHPISITVHASVGTWLLHTNGTLIDPRQLLTNSTLHAIVHERIADSFHAFEDDDHDGRDDHEHG